MLLKAVCYHLPVSLTREYLVLRQRPRIIVLAHPDLSTILALIGFFTTFLRHTLFLLDVVIHDIGYGDRWTDIWWTLNDQYVSFKSRWSIVEIRESFLIASSLFFFNADCFFYGIMYDILVNFGLPICEFKRTIDRPIVATEHLSFFNILLEYRFFLLLVWFTMWIRHWWTEIRRASNERYVTDKQVINRVIEYWKYLKKITNVRIFNWSEHYIISACNYSQQLDFLNNPNFNRGLWQFDIQNLIVI